MASICPSGLEGPRKPTEFSTYLNQTSVLKRAQDVVSSPPASQPASQPAGPSENMEDWLPEGGRPLHPMNDRGANVSEDVSVLVADKSSSRKA